MLGKSLATRAASSELDEVGGALLAVDPFELQATKTIAVTASAHAHVMPVRRQRPRASSVCNPPTA
jgi:hypothetical protein